MYGASVPPWTLKPISSAPVCACVRVRVRVRVRENVRRIGSAVDLEAHLFRAGPCECACAHTRARVSVCLCAHLQNLCVLQVVVDEGVDLRQTGVVKAGHAPSLVVCACVGARVSVGMCGCKC